jgi:hypothetical protein
MLQGHWNVLLFHTIGTVMILLPCRYGLFLTSLALSILFSEGWLGPLSCLLTLILPPEIKAFGLSVWSAGYNIIMPAGNVIFGIYLTVRCLVMPAGCHQLEGCVAVEHITRGRAVAGHCLSRCYAHPRTAALRLPERLSVEQCQLSMLCDLRAGTAGSYIAARSQDAPFLWSTLPCCALVLSALQ